MKVAFYLADQNPQRDRSLGITGYTDGLLRALVADESVTISGLGAKGAYRAPAGVAMHLLPFSTAGGANRFLADNLHPFIRRIEADIWHYPKGHLPLAGRYRQPVIGTVHDLILQHYADRYPTDRSAAAYRYWLTVLKRSIPRFDLILTISKFSEAAIREFCDRHRLHCPEIRVTYLGFHVETKSDAPIAKQDVVVHLASRELHKRTATLLEFWEQLSQVEQELPLLKLIGNLRAADQARVARVRGIEICGRLNRKDLESEIAQARALIFPSEIEGFGLPAVEAYALGTPVVYVLGTAVEEVLGEGTRGGFLLDDFETFRSALQAALELPHPFIEQHAVQLASRFSWARCAAATLAAYRQATGT
ncbi:MAG: glycosyltransferase [Chthoniobacterales bacterium]|nr:glycosyltransferase [Chthoniobacterales bacterium]